LFPHCIEAARLLGVDEEFQGKLEAALKRLPPYRINRLGYLQEWIEDWKAGNQGHNVSPNFTFYPGCSIRLRRDAELAGAIAKWMETRRSGGGWPASWDMAVWARLERGDKVAFCLRNLIRNSLAPNLHNAGANQSDASFGLTAAVAEALLQSHAGEISLLPALPEGWNGGSITGLRARGGYEVSLQWKNRKLQSAEIRTSQGGSCKLRSGERTSEKLLKPGDVVRVDASLASAN
jgi:alpha-L-fucosidase 2